jgi:cell division protein FtsQ
VSSDRRSPRPQAGGTARRFRAAVPPPLRDGPAASVAAAAGSAARGGGPGGLPPGGRWKALFFALASAGILAVLAWALLGSGLLVVRSVQVTGTGRLVSRSQVIAAAAIPYGLPLIRLDTAAVARRVERLPPVQSVQVSRDWPGTVTITVRQRRPVFAVPAPGGGYGLVDAAGVTVTTAARRPPGLPRLSAGPPGAALRGNPGVRAAADVLRELPRQLADRVRVVTASGPQDVTLRLARGVTIVWGGPERAAEKLKEVTVLMRTHARWYDVSGAGTAVTQG